MTLINRLNRGIDLWIGFSDEIFLSKEELERADRYLTEQARRKFISSRSTLRYLLGKYCNTDPLQLEFVYNSYGKPRLKNGEIQFNLSHSGDLSLFAFAIGCEIGVDIELRDEIDGAEGIVRRFFSEEEQSQFFKDPAIFFRLWTQKEAYLKAVGTGFSRMDVRNDFMIEELDYGPKYAAALSYSGPMRVKHRFTL